MYNKSIAVLLTCHNRKAKTLECLSALYVSELPVGTQIKVFLVDDGSTDGTSEAVSKFYPDVFIVQGSGSLYWNRGMYLAWKTAVSHAKYDFYLWLNDDTILTSSGLCEMIDCAVLTENGTNSIICGAICSSENQAFSYGGATVEGLPIEPNGEIQNCYKINGNCVLISKDVYEKIGNLDPIYPHAIGDHDYGLRAIKANVKVLTTRSYVAYCERNARLPNWCYPETPILERFKSLYSPLGNSHPKYFFIYEKRHFGILMSLKHFLSIHLRVLMPSLWKY
jgi:GT2 family glycosyltransferase